MADVSVPQGAGRTDHGPVGTFGSTVAIVFDECGAHAYSLACRLLDGDALRAEAVVQIVPDRCRRDDVVEVDISEIVLRSVRQQCIELIRKSKGLVLHASDVQASPGRPGTEELTGAAQHVRQSLASLPFDQRTAVEMAFFDGRTSKEIALRTGGTIQDVHRRLRSGLHRFAASMSSEGNRETSR